jgi:mRNA-degrading endonuclease RelE of RelBE toxin-antitoxin system
MSDRYEVVLSASAERDLARLPELTASDVRRFLDGPLRRDPHKAGTPLSEQQATMLEATDKAWRILYRVDANTRTVRVMVVGHRPRVVRRITNPRPAPFG